MMIRMEWQEDRQRPEWQDPARSLPPDGPQFFVTTPDVPKMWLAQMEGPVLSLPYDDWQALGGPVVITVRIQGHPS